MPEKSKKKIDTELQASIKEVRPFRFSVWAWILFAAIFTWGLFSVISSTQVLTTCPYEPDALVTLRALSNVELAYRDFNDDHRYASFDALRMHDFVNIRFDETNLVPGYRFEITPLSFHNDTVHSFVIRIFPTQPGRPCGVFQMGPDRKLYEFLPRVSHDIHNSDNWVDVSYILELLPPRHRLPWMGENYSYN